MRQENNVVVELVKQIQALRETARFAIVRGEDSKRVQDQLEAETKKLEAEISLHVARYHFATRSR